MSRKLVYDFEWDIAKAITNVTKHGVSFDQAATVFLDAMALTVYDAARAATQRERRYYEDEPR